MKTVYYISFLLLFQSIGLIAQNNFHLKNAELSKRLKETPGLVALWDFKEKEGHARKAYGMGTFPLKEENGTLTRIQEAYFGLFCKVRKQSIFNSGECKNRGTQYFWQ